MDCHSNILGGKFVLQASLMLIEVVLISHVGSQKETKIKEKLLGIEVLRFF
jgi:hypothetical protein